MASDAIPTAPMASRVAYHGITDAIHTVTRAGTDAIPNDCRADQSSLMVAPAGMSSCVSSNCAGKVMLAGPASVTFSPRLPGNL